MSMIDSCCQISDNFIEFLENLNGNEECLDDELIESLNRFSSQQEIAISSLDEDILKPLHDNPFHHQQESIAPSLDETNWDQEREVPILDPENENHQINVNFFKTHFYHLSEDEIDRLLESHITTQANVDLQLLQCLHSQECVIEAYSIIENKILGLNDDIHETGEAIS